MLKNGSDLTKSEEKRLLSRYDFVLIIVLILMALASFAFLKITQKSGQTVTVTIDGETYGSYDLNMDQEIEIKGSDFVSLFVISDGKVSMTQADCPDQICVKHTPISHDGETIVCLPHKLVLTVEEDNPTTENDVDIIVK